jgi:hypothetical protein
MPRPHSSSAVSATRVLTEGSRLLLRPGFCWWPFSAVATTVTMLVGGGPNVVVFIVGTLLSTALLAVVSVTVAEAAASGQGGMPGVYRQLVGRLPTLALLGMVIRLVSDATTPLGVGLVLSAGWALAVPLGAVEGLRGSEALRASWQLTRGLLLRLGLIRLAAVLLTVAASALCSAVVGRMAGHAIAELLAGTLIGPFPLVVQAVLYRDIRALRASIGPIGVGSIPNASAM